MAGAGFGDPLGDSRWTDLRSKSWRVQEGTKDSVQQLEMVRWEGHGADSRLELACCAQPLPGSVGCSDPSRNMGRSPWNLHMAKGGVPSWSPLLRVAPWYRSHVFMSPLWHSEHLPLALQIFLTAFSAPSAGRILPKK